MADPHLSEKRDAVYRAFVKAHDGYSTDRVVVDDALNKNFRIECERLLPAIGDREANWILLNFRKSSTLGSVTTKRSRFRHDEYRFAAEIAARRLEDVYDLTLDQILCDPILRVEFDRLASELAPNVENLRLRLAALGLRKARKLVPEHFKRFVSKRAVISYEATYVAAHVDELPNGPGIYMFYGATHGWLYVGEAKNLRRRVSQHIDHSDRKHLAHYFWSSGLFRLSPFLRRRGLAE